jgi:hypothetical protein
MIEECEHMCTSEKPLVYVVSDFVLFLPFVVHLFWHIHMHYLAGQLLLAEYIHSY